MNYDQLLAHLAAVHGDRRRRGWQGSESWYAHAVHHDTGICDHRHAPEDTVLYRHTGLPVPVLEGG